KKMSEEIEEIFSYYGKQRDKSSQEMVVSLLRELQEVEGCITPELKRRVMETTEVTDKFLNCLIKMYPSIKEVKQVHEIIACTGERCAKKDGMTILQNLRRELGIKKDGSSADGRIELRTRNCLKQCRTSPNMYIDGKLYSGEQLKNIKKLLNDVCKEE
uniref:NADH-quinone oxidoreductase subunit NuoE family protein n=1 Tax=[Ruminococcus] torques TaxID=33039 RepID=UPI00402AD75B